MIKGRRLQFVFSCTTVPVLKMTEKRNFSQAGTFWIFVQSANHLKILEKYGSRGYRFYARVESALLRPWKNYFALVSLVHVTMVETTTGI